MQSILKDNKSNAPPAAGLLDAVVASLLVRPLLLFIGAATDQMFAPETPSRVLRQIERLNQQDLPDLPGLPSELPSFSEDGDSTVAHSPPPRKPQSLPPVSPAARENHPPPTPYSSTPAPSLYQRTQATIVPATGSSERSGNDTTATIGPGGRFSSVRRGRATPTLTSGQLPGEPETSYERSVSEIAKAPSLEEEREDMLVLSGGSGTEDNASSSFRRKQGRSAELSALPPARLETQEQTEEVTDQSDVEGNSSDGPHPLDALGLLESSAVSPATVKHQSPRLPAPPSPVNQILPAGLSPLRAANNTVETSIASPEVARHSSPQHSPHAHQSFSREATPSRLSSKSPSTSLTPNGGRTPRFDSPLASLDLNLNPTTPAANPDAAERRKAHLLATLRSTAKQPLLRGTPHPTRSARKASPQSAGAAGNDEDRTSSSFASDRSSNDLTTFHKANTSLPSGGSADAGGAIGGARGSRFNGAKLNAYLHSLNTHLTEENQSLAKAVSRMTKDHERVEAENRRLNDTIREMSMVGGVTVDLSRARNRTSSIEEEEEGEEERSRVELLGEELEGLVEGQRRIRGLQDELSGELQAGAGTAERIKELEVAVQRVQGQLEARDQEIGALREQVASGAREDGEEGRADLHREVFELKDRLSAAEDARDTAQSDLDKLQAELAAADEPSEQDFVAQQARIEELGVELEQKDQDLVASNKALADQETEFSDAMKNLEDELCKVTDRAREDFEAERRENEQLRKEDREKIARLELERDELERQLLDGTADIDHAMEEKVHSLRDEIAQLEETVKSLRRDVSTRDEALESMQEELELAEGRLKEREAIETEDADELRRQLEAKDADYQQLDEAFDNATQQLVQHEDTILALQRQLDNEQKRGIALSAQLSHISVPKAKSPLANEVYNSAKDEIIASLEEELEEAHRAAEELREKLTVAEQGRRDAELRELEVKKLQEDKANLEGCIRSLREQSVLFPPNKTPDKSWILRPLPSVLTPKTPGQFASNVCQSTCPPGSVANETITPDLMQIAELQHVVEGLREQITEAYEQVDDKIGRLDSAGSSNLALARHLSDAEGRIAQLEEQLEILLGEGGSLDRVKARLAKVHCPECQSSFDANKSVQLRVDRTGVSFAGPQGESLRATLASVNAKVKELQVENDVLQNKAARSQELAEEKKKLTGHHESLQRDLKQARDEIAVLEADLRTERSRLRTLASEQTQAAKAKTALEARLATSDSELRQVKRQLAGAASADVLHRLQKDKAQLVSERDDLARQLHNVNERATRVDTDLTSTRAGQTAMQTQLESQITEIQFLRDSLQSSKVDQRHMQDERSDILRGVASLQADLKRVREDAVSLGLDLAAVRRERDELGARKEGEMNELVRVSEDLSLAKREVLLLKKRIDEHTCAGSTDPQAVAGLKKQHKLEVRGCMKRILQLQREVTREFSFRSELSGQKTYLNGVITEKQATIDSILKDFSSLMGTPPPTPTVPARSTLRNVTCAIIAINRMRRLAKEWSQHTAEKKVMREREYPKARGKPWPRP
ncbi:hypothetical protein JCM11641_001137 [Rhodosporidiobolus odoratus]